EIILPITMLLVLRLLLRRTWAAIVVITLLVVVMFLPESGSVLGYLVSMGLSVPLVWLVLFRAGLLSFVTMFPFATMTDDLLLSLHPPAWYLGSMLLTLVFIIGPALYGFWAS